MDRESKLHQRHKYPAGRPEPIDSGSVEVTLGEVKAAVNELILEKHTEYQERYPVVGAVLFGSWHHRDPHAESDVDIGLIIDWSKSRDLEDFDEREFPELLRQKLGELGLGLDRYAETWFILLDEPEFDFTSRGILHGDFEVITPFPAVQREMTRHDHYRYYPRWGDKFVTGNMKRGERPIARLFELLTRIRQR